MACGLEDILRARKLTMPTGLRVALAVCEAVAGLHGSFPYMLHGDLRVRVVI